MKKSRMLAVLPLLAASAGLAQTDADINKLTPAETQQGFSLLFDGTLQSFKDNFQDYKQENTPTNNGGLSGQWDVDNNLKAIILKANTTDIRSKKMYKDFDWRFDYRCDNNQGVFYRFLTRNGAPYESGVEFAIDNRTDPCSVCPGAVYDVFPPTKNAYNFWDNNNVAGNKWNTLRLVAKGDSVEHWLNGQLVNAFTYHNKRWWDAYNKSKWSSASSMSVSKQGDRSSGPILDGFIGLQSNHGGKWQIRNFKINTTATVAFGPIKTEPVVSLSVKALAARPKLGFSSSGFGSGKVSFFFEGGSPVKKANLVSLAGKTVADLNVSSEGRSATANQISQVGSYFLVYQTEIATYSEKISLF